MKNILLYCFLSILPLCSSGQFFGGPGDGMISALKRATFNSQFAYCTGNASDGTDMAYLMGFPFNHSIVFSGGNADGSAYLNKKTSLNNQGIYCYGGTGDGMAFINVYDFLNDHSIYCSGGNGDGLSYIIDSTFIFGLSIFCKGSSGDGFCLPLVNKRTLNQQFIYCTGNPGDGAAFSIFYGQVNDKFIYYGGDCDGFDKASAEGLLMGIGIWTGNLSHNWNTAENWKHDIIPDHNTNVFIPPSRQHYPLLNQTFAINSASGEIKCRRLDIGNNGFFDTRKDFFNDGTLNVYGTFNSWAGAGDTSIFQQTGTTIIHQGGIMRIGNQ